MTKYPLIKKWKEKRKNLFEEFVHVVIVEIARAWHYDKNGLCSIEICNDIIGCYFGNAAFKCPSNLPLYFYLWPED